MSQPEMTDAEIAARNAKFKRRLPASAVDLATSMGLCLDDETSKEVEEIILAYDGQAAATRPEGGACAR